LSDVEATESNPYPDRKRPPRAAYALPTLFTAGNIFLGYLSVIHTLQAALAFTTNPASAPQHFEIAAATIGLAVVLDGLDGRIARMTNTTSEFGKELDSLADIVSFGIAPAILAYVWGVEFVDKSYGPVLVDQLQRWGKFVAFLFLVCGAGRLARFNIQKNPVPKNPGSPNRKYFVGLAIPAAAGVVAAIVYFMEGYPVTSFGMSVAWQALLAVLAFLMVSTWRYWSFKEFNFFKTRSPIMLILMAAFIYAAANWSRYVLLAIATLYMSSGVLTRIGGLLRRYVFRRNKAEVSIG